MEMLKTRLPKLKELSETSESCVDLFDQLKGGVKEFPAVTDLKDPDIYCDVARIGIHISYLGEKGRRLGVRKGDCLKGTKGLPYTSTGLVDRPPRVESRKPSSKSRLRFDNFLFWMKKKNSGARFCVPRVKTNLSRTTAGDRNISVTPMTLLDRFREAVLRIIMISAPSIPTPHRSKPTRVNSQKYYNSTDTYHNEAVADCIEFIRTSKGNDVENGR
ncbi:hypothetical protein YC2023_072471 [Brassica napus]